MRQVNHFPNQVKSQSRKKSSLTSSWNQVKTCRKVKLRKSGELRVPISLNFEVKPRYSLTQIQVKVHVNHVFMELFSDLPVGS